MTAAIGRQLKQSVNVFHNLMLYRRLPNHTLVNSIFFLYPQNGFVCMCVCVCGKKEWILTLIVKAVYTIDAGRLMVSTQNEKVLGVLDLVSQ